MKRFFICILTLCALCSLYCFSSFAEEPDETSTAYFFLHKYNYTRDEDGTTIAYPLNDYLPNAEHHYLIEGQVYNTATGESSTAINTKLEAGVALTTEEIAQLRESFSDIEEALGEGYPTPQNNAVLKNLILANYNVTLADIESGSVQVLWYVIKTGNSIGNDGCPYHVDGVVYNIETGSFVEPITTYKYTVLYNFYSVKNNEVTFDGSTEETYGVDAAAALKVTAPKNKSYKEELYSMKDEDESTIEIVPTEDGVIVEFNFYREITIELPEKEDKNEPEQPLTDITKSTEEVSINTATTTAEEPSPETNKTGNLTTIDSPKTYDPAIPLWVIALLIALIFIIFSFY